MTDLTLKFRIEGVGFDTSETTAADFAYRTNPSHGLPALAEKPSPPRESINPLSGDVRLAKYSPTLRYGKQDPTAADQAATTFFHRDTRGFSSLAGSITTSDSLIAFDQDENASGREGEVIYIDSEAIKLGNYDSATNSYDSCVRDYWSIQNGIGARPHDEEARAYDAPPYWKGRLIELRVVRDGTESVEWTGVIYRAETGNKGATVELECDSLWSTVLSRQLGEIAEITRGDEAVFGSTEASDGPELEYAWSNIYDTRVMKSATAGINRGVALQKGQSLYLLDAGARQERPLLDSGPGDFGNIYPAREVAVFGKRIADAFDAYDDQAIGRPIPTDNLTHPHHPVTIARAHIESARWSDTESGHDVMQGEFGMGLEGLISVNGTAVADTSYLEVDHWVTGWDGEPRESSSILAFLHRWGFVLAPSSDGSGVIKRWGMPTVDDLDGAKSVSANPGTLHDDRGYDTQVDKITANFGGAPWREEGRAIESSIENKPQPDWEKGEELTLDYPGISVKNRQKAISLLSAEQQYLKYGFETLTIAVDDASNVSGVSDWELFDWLEVTDLPPQKKWRVVSGSRENASGGVDWTGLIVGLQKSWQNDAYELELLIPRTGLVRYRSVAMEIVQTDQTVDRVYGPDTSAFSPSGGAANDDLDVGDDVVVCDKHGQQVQSSVYEIDAIGSNSTGAYVEIAGTFDSDPANDPNHFLRLAQYDDYDNTSTASSVDLAWMYLADAAGTLGSADDAAHVYGR